MLYRVENFLPSGISVITVTFGAYALKVKALGNQH